MKRKIIAVTTGTEGEAESLDHTLYALCDDGTAWSLSSYVLGPAGALHEQWHPVPEIPQGKATEKGPLLINREPVEEK